MESNMARRDKTDAWDERREQPQGEATPRPEDIATSPSEQCTFHYPLPIQFKDHIEILQCILKRGHSGQHRAATGETWRGSWEGQAQAEGGEKLQFIPDYAHCARCKKADNLHLPDGVCPEPSSPPATAGTANLYVPKAQYDAMKAELKAEVAQLRQERDALTKAFDNVAEARRREIEARVRAEKALREIGQQLMGCNLSEANCASVEVANRRIRTLGRMALASLKSSESTK